MLPALDPIEHDPGGKVKMTLPLGIRSFAEYSDCKKYRYYLTRTWNKIENDVRIEPLKTVMFLMMNPSTATEHVDDPTVRKCRVMANSWGYNSLIIANIMAYRATNPKDLLTVNDPVGPYNLKTIEYLLNGQMLTGGIPMGGIFNKNPLLICAWGRIPAKLSYAEEDAMRRIKNHSPHILRLNKDGKPWHPLYLPNDTIPQPWIID